MDSLRVRVLFSHIAKQLMMNKALKDKGVIFLSPSVNSALNTVTLPRGQYQWFMRKKIALFRTTHLLPMMTEPDVIISSFGWKALLVSMLYSQ